MKKALCLCFLVSLISQIHTNGKPKKLVVVSAAADRCRVFVVRQPLLSAGDMLFFKHFPGEIDIQIFALVLRNSASMSG